MVSRKAKVNVIFTFFSQKLNKALDISTSLLCSHWRSALNSAFLNTLAFLWMLILLDIDSVHPSFSASLFIFFFCLIPGYLIYLALNHTLSSLHIGEHQGKEFRVWFSFYSYYLVNFKLSVDIRYHLYVNDFIIFIQNRISIDHAHE